MKQIGQIVKQRRKNLSITQKELAELAGIGINTLTKIERGASNPSLDILQKVLDALGLEIIIQTKKTDL